MNNLEETYQHPAISCIHKLDLSDFEGLAAYLSQQLHLTIEMCFDKSPILYNKTIHFQDVFEKCRLIERKSSLIPELKFEKHNVAHPALFQNDNILIFVSDNDSSKGKSDLFYSFNENGKWSKPINMLEINTEYTETFPTVFDDKLYFASDRPGGSGGLDIYVTVFMDGQWLKPVRMPSPINS